VAADEDDDEDVTTLVLKALQTLVLMTFGRIVIIEVRAFNPDDIIG